LPDVATVAIHHEELKSFINPARKHNPFAIGRPRWPAIDVSFAGNIMIV
jgi:hypothetical protein